MYTKSCYNRCIRPIPMFGDEWRLPSGEAAHYFDVEGPIAAGHMLRRIDAVLDQE